MKTVEILVMSEPDSPQTGYGDNYSVYDDNGNTIVSGHCSTCPNPWRTEENGEQVLWRDAYGWIAPGEYIAECVDSRKYGKSLLLEGGRCIRSRVPNAAQYGRMTMDQIFIHEGGYGCKNPLWRGSKGCITIPKQEWENFISVFKYGETARVAISDFLGDKKGAPA